MRAGMPRMAGTAKRPQEMMIEKAADETIAGVTSGSVTVRTTISGRAPATRAASSKLPSTEESAASTVRKTKA